MPVMRDRAEPSARFFCSNLNFGQTVRTYRTTQIYSPHHPSTPRVQLLAQFLQPGISKFRRMATPENALLTAQIG